MDRIWRGKKVEAWSISLAEIPWFCSFVFGDLILIECVGGSRKRQRKQNGESEECERQLLHCSAAWFWKFLWTQITVPCCWLLMLWEGGVGGEKKDGAREEGEGEGV